MIFLQLYYSNSGNIIKIENAVYFNPLKSNEVIIAAERRSKMAPDILCNKIVFILC